MHQLTCIVSRDEAAIRIRIRIVWCERPAKRQKTNPTKQCFFFVFFPRASPCSLSGIGLEVRGPFHAAIRVARKRCDSCAQGALERRTVSRRNFCDAESLAKRYREHAARCTKHLPGFRKRGRWNRVASIFPFSSFFSVFPLFYFRFLPFFPFSSVCSVSFCSFRVFPVSFRFFPFFPFLLFLRVPIFSVFFLFFVSFRFLPCFSISFRFFRFLPFSSVFFLFHFQEKRTGRHHSRDPFCATPTWGAPQCEKTFGNRCLWELVDNLWLSQCSDGKDL